MFQRIQVQNPDIPLRNLYLIQMFHLIVESLYRVPSALQALLLMF